MKKINNEYLIFEEYLQESKENIKTMFQYLILFLFLSAILIVIMYQSAYIGLNIGIFMLTLGLIGYILILFYLLTCEFQKDEKTYNEYVERMYREDLEQQKKQKEKKLFEKNFEAWKNE